MSAQQMMDVELIGGPMDGWQESVPVRADPAFNMYLFRRMDPAGRRQVLAYAFRGRSLNGGACWALEFFAEVARVPKAKGGSHD